MSKGEKGFLDNYIFQGEVIEKQKEEIRILKEKLKLNGVNRSTKVNKTKLSVKCLHCGRSFIKKLHHKCNTGYRKRNHKWLELTDD